MEEEFFEKEFNFAEYLDKKLLEISDLEHRKELKEVTKQVMLPFYEYVERKYRCLEEKMQEDAAWEQDYTVYIGVEEKNKVDLTEESMRPMQMRDMEMSVLEESALRLALKEKTPCTLFSVFFKLEYKKMEELLAAARIFCGSIRTKEGIYPAKFQLKECKKYREQVHKLYSVFVRNMIAWKTVNMSYLYKFVDVELIEADIPEDEVIEEVKIDFEEYKDAVRYQMIPLWNIARLTVRDSGYPELCLDHIHYKHVIFHHKLKEGNAYLVDNPDIGIYNIERINGDIAISCDQEKDISWNLLEFHQPGEQKREYPHFGNKDIGHIAGKIHTKAEITKFIKNLNYERYLLPAEVHVERAAFGQKEHYDMNEGLLDEIRQSETGLKLMLDFVPVNPDTYINSDIVSYIVSRLQWEFPEYQCCGHLVRGGVANEQN